MDVFPKKTCLQVYKHLDLATTVMLVFNQKTGEKPMDLASSLRQI
jgi:hypothetical protein